MQVFEDITTCACSIPDLVLTIGSFDGVHRGHQYVLDEVNRIARERGGSSGLMSLWPHPRAFFNPEDAPAQLTSPTEKEQLLSTAGLDAYFVLPFDARIARMDREEFLRHIVLKHCGAQCLVVGHDFTFGAGARGDFSYLSEVSIELGLDVVQLPPCSDSGGMRISSTEIRNGVRQGDMERVHALLGRPYRLTGTVVRGRGLGRGLGFPTANIMPPEKLLPNFGIYGARVYWGDNQALGAVNIGVAPTLEHTSPMIEVHVLDVDTDLVGQELSIDLFHRLRGEAKFPDLSTLIAAIGADIVAVRDFFSAVDEAAQQPD